MSENKSLNFVKDNIIFIHGEFDKTLVTDVFPSFYSLIDQEKAKKNGKIKISINSYGGQAQYLQTFWSFIEQAKNEEIIIETVVENRALSCGSLLAIAGTKGHRYITTWGQHLVHYGSGGAVGTNEIDFDKYQKEFKIHKKRMKEAYTYYTNLKMTQVNKLQLNDNSFLFADECIKFGLADKIIGNEKMFKPATLSII